MAKEKADSVLLIFELSLMSPDFVSTIFFCQRVYIFGSI
jgi:hypothetical protein